MAQTTANLVATCLSNSNNMETENINTNDIEAPAEEVHDNPGTESSVSNCRLAASGSSDGQRARFLGMGRTGIAH